jgi:hypothetical protein
MQIVSVTTAYCSTELQRTAPLVVLRSNAFQNSRIKQQTATDSRNWQLQNTLVAEHNNLSLLCTKVVFVSIAIDHRQIHFFPSQIGGRAADLWDSPHGRYTPHGIHHHWRYLFPSRLCHAQCLFLSLTAKSLIFASIYFSMAAYTLMAACPAIGALPMWNHTPVALVPSRAPSSEQKSLIQKNICANNFATSGRRGRAISSTRTRRMDAR